MNAFLDFRWLTLLFLVALGFVQSCTSLPQKSVTAGEALQPVMLRVELLKGQHVKNISDRQPEFSWQLASGDGLAKQSAYRIQLWQGYYPDRQLVWDSGKQASSQSVAVSYQGEPLALSSNYEWRVKVWTKANNAPETTSAWSQSQLFTTAQQWSDDASRYDLLSSRIGAKHINKLASGNILIDFGKVGFGYLALSLSSDKAGELDIHFGERGNGQGVKRDLHRGSSVRYYRVPLQVYAQKDQYRVHPPKNKRNTKAPKAIAIPARFGRVAPFRYVEIDPKGLNITDVSAEQVMVHYPFDEQRSSFSSSDAVLDAIWDLCKYSMKATSFAGVYVDGDRERIPYEADAYINQLSHYLVDDEYSLARHSHEYLMRHPTWPTEWKQHSVMMAWMDWMYSGDLESLQNQYAQLKAEKTLAQFRNQQGLLETFPKRNRTLAMGDIVDWPPSERDGYELLPVNTVVNGFYYLNIQQMADMANALGKQDDYQHYRQELDALKEAFNNAFFNAETGLYVDGVGSSHSSVHANIMPLAVGLVPDDKRHSVVAFIKSKGMAVSVYFAQYLMEALYLSGEADYALQLLTSQQQRSWYNMLRVGSTITLEAWDDKFKKNQDWNHAWGAVPGNIIGRYVLGVRPIRPGFETFMIAPQPSHIASVQGRVPTIRGPVDVDFNQTSQAMRLSVVIPWNSSALVSLPVPQGVSDAIASINGERVEYRVLSGRLVFDKPLEAGNYELEVSF